jgi:hypothetical protein
MQVLQTGQMPMSASSRANSTVATMGNDPRLSRTCATSPLHLRLLRFWRAWWPIMMARTRARGRPRAVRAQGKGSRPPPYRRETSADRFRAAVEHLSRRPTAAAKPNRPGRAVQRPGYRHASLPLSEEGDREDGQILGFTGHQFEIRLKIWVLAFGNRYTSHERWNTPHSQSSLLGFRRVSNAANERTSIAAILPMMPMTYGWIVLLNLQPRQEAILCANFNSLVFDYLLRSSLSQPAP